MSRDSRDISYLKGAKTQTVVAACKSHGPISFIGDGLTENQKLDVLTSAVTDLDHQLTMMTTFFTTRTDSDDSYESVVYSVDDFNPNFRYVRIRKTINYQSVCVRQPAVENGPLMERDTAEAFVALLNR